MTTIIRLFFSPRVLVFAVALTMAVVSSAARAEDRPLYRDAADETGSYACLSPEEGELFRLINEYRESNGLPPLRNSRSLTKVARVHAIDIHANKPETAMDPSGQPCILHSWSERGFWTPMCYTADHRAAEKMWNKPREITNYVYSGDGYENVYWTSEKTVAVRRVIDAWKKSPSHNALMLENGAWKGSNLLSLGVGIYNNVAAMWVGMLIDPAGELPVCAGR